MRDRKNKNKKETDIDFSSGDKISELRKDVKEIKETESNNKLAKLKDFASKNRFALIAISVVSGIAIYFYLGYEIPEWLIFVTLGTLGSFIITYPYVDKAVSYFIEDNRVPIIEIDDEMDKFGVVGVPRDEIPNIEVNEGELYPVGTKKEAEAYQVESVSIEEKDGDRKIKANASWEGSISNYERKQKYSKIEENREQLEPAAKNWLNFKFRRSIIVQQITEMVINRYAREFEGVVHEDDLFEEIEGIVEDTQPMNDKEIDNAKEYSMEDLKEIADIATNGEK